MKWKLLLPNRIKVMYYWAKLIGLAPFTLNKYELDPPTLVGKVYPVTVVSIVLFLSSIRIYEELEIQANETTEETVGQMIGVSYYVVSLMSTSLSIIIFLLMHKQIVELTNKLCSMSNDFKSLGIEEDGGKISRNIFATVVSLNVLNEAAAVVLYLLDSQSYIILWMLHIINNLITLNVILMFTQILLCIGHRFTLVNEQLYSFDPTPNDNSPLRLQSPAVFVDGEENEADSEDLTGVQRLRKMEILHLELYDLVDRTTYIFAAPFLLCTLRLLYKFLMYSYWLFHSLSNICHLTAEEYFSSKWLPDLTFLWHLMFSAIQLFIITRACVTTCKQGNATRIVLSTLRRKIESSELQDELYMFFIQLLHTPVVISVYEFFDLDYGLLYKIFCTVVTYLIIVIQLEKPRTIGGT